MAGFTGIKDVVDAELDGKVRQYSWRKTPSAATTIGVWFDISMAAGNPIAKFWFDSAPLVAKAIAQSTDGGIFHGANVSPAQKCIRSFTAMTATSTALPLTMWVCDYLLYYPTIADDTLDVQTLDNTVTLPRWTDGDGVQIMLVNLAGRTGGGTLTINYTNSDGVAGRTSQTVLLNSSSVVGTIASSNRAASVNQQNPFVGLQDGDSGVRSVQSVTMSVADSGGLFALLLVKPLFQTQIRGIDAPVEKDLLMQSEQMPIIQDDAFISFACLPQGTLAATALIGDMKVVWN